MVLPSPPAEISPAHESALKRVQTPRAFRLPLPAAGVPSSPADSRRALRGCTAAALIARRIRPSVRPSSRLPLPNRSCVKLKRGHNLRPSPLQATSFFHWIHADVVSELQGGRRR